MGLRDPRCPECGRLFDPHDSETYSTDVGGLVKLFVGDTAADTHLLKDILLDAGIKAVVLGDSLDVTNGILPAMHGAMPAVWVGSRDLELAAPITEEFIQTRHTVPEVEGKPWTCPNCDESMEAQFSTCWACGCDRPDMPS